MPQGYQFKGKDNLVCRLKNILYGLNQAPRKWYLKFDKFMTEHGYSDVVLTTMFISIG